MTKDEMIVIARQTANKYALPPDIICGICEQESSWNPWSIRFEPLFLAHYVKKLNLSPSEETARSISWGLMQIMGEEARERGFSGTFLSELCDPPIGIEFGCRAFQHKMAMNSGNLDASLLSYNGGADIQYARDVLQKSNYYRNSQA